MAFPICSWITLLVVLAVASAQDHDHGSLSDEMVDMTHACFSDPNKMSCMDASGFYPESAVMMDMSSLCESLPWLTGCSVKRLCDTERATGKYCTPWSIAASLCNKDDHHGHHANQCGRHNALCMPESGATMVGQCETAMVPKLPTTALAFDKVMDLCAAHPDMPQCAQCGGSAPGPACEDALATTAEICLSHRMDACDAWFEMCALKPEGLAAFCGDVEALPEEEPVCYGVMKMYFHWGYDDFVLFRGWVPCTAGAYVGTVVAVMAAAILSALLKAVRSRCEQTWVRTAAVQPAKAPSTTWALLPSDMGEARQNATRMLFIMASTVIDYALMLVAMTFNVGLFFAIAVGFGLGGLLFGHTVIPIGAPTVDLTPDLFFASGPLRTRGIV